MGESISEPDFLPYIKTGGKLKRSGQIVAKYFEKSAFLPVISFGGRSKNYIAEDVPVLRNIQPGVGYTNILGVLPWPDLELRFGKVRGPGVSIGTAGLGISDIPSRSFKMRHNPRGLLDIAVERLEGEMDVSEAINILSKIYGVDKDKVKTLVDKISQKHGVSKLSAANWVYEEDGKLKDGIVELKKMNKNWRDHV